MIKSPEIIQSHLKMSSRADNTTHRKLIFSRSLEYSNINLTECHLNSILYSLCASSVTRAAKIQYPATGKGVEIVGSSNGLVGVVTRFIAGEEQCLYLWNPFIRRFSRLPHWGFDFKSSYLGPYGFEYVELQDDHKLVALVCDSSLGFQHPKYQVLKIYSRKSNFWKRIEGSKNDLSPEDWRVSHGGTFVNGNIHWAAESCRNRGHSSVNKVVSFDLAGETYGDIELPAIYMGMRDSRKWGIGILGEGYLSLLWYHVQEKVDVNLWIMTEYGVGQSWTKMFMIRHPEDDLKHQFFRPAILPCNLCSYQLRVSYCSKSGPD